MNVVLVGCEVLIATDSMIGKSALPDFSFATEDRAEDVRISTLDELNRMLDRDVDCGSEQEMHVLRHQDEGVQLISAFAAVSIDGLQEQACIVFDNEESSSVPCPESYEVCSGRGDEACGFQGQTSAAKAAAFA